MYRLIMSFHIRTALRRYTLSESHIRTALRRYTLSESESHVDVAGKAQGSTIKSSPVLTLRFSKCARTWYCRRVWYCLGGHFESETVITLRFAKCMTGVRGSAFSQSDLHYLVLILKGWYCTEDVCLAAVSGNHFEIRNVYESRVPGGTTFVSKWSSLSGTHFEKFLKVCGDVMADAVRKVLLL